MSISQLLEPDRRFMKEALRQAEYALEAGEVPVGAVVVHNQLIVGRGHNQVERLQDPTAHAEIIAITAACETLGSKYLSDCTLYVTLEPCPMCAGALVQSKLLRLVYGALDAKAGADCSLFTITNDPRLNHRVQSISGVMEEESASMLRHFFSTKRLPSKTR